MILDPDCRDGKHRTCFGGPCECDCHKTTTSADVPRRRLVTRPPFTVPLSRAGGAGWAIGPSLPTAPARRLKPPHPTDGTRRQG